ncbi:MAG: hypothetical protein GY906_10065 [bacterium]|nr:hypothetical protein [bacterium]
MALTKINVELTASEMHSAITQYIAEVWANGDELRTILEEHVELTDVNKFYIDDIEADITTDDSVEFKVVACFTAHRHG